ncbi:hypothetical protein ACIOG8_37650 [Streptomyces erythrochromogenes]|uniref:hypothetical protein n=1 Tax=Streptomyces erythrochromogenes TaxID=285574 RepID=UPI003824493B
MRRWSLPLLLLALLTAPGCVTVHPSPVLPIKASPAVVPHDDKPPATARPEQPDRVPARPLSRLPEPATTPPTAAAPEAVHAPSPRPSGRVVGLTPRPDARRPRPGLLSDPPPSPRR